MKKNKEKTSSRWFWSQIKNQENNKIYWKRSDTLGIDVLQVSNLSVEFLDLVLIESGFGLAATYITKFRSQRLKWGKVSEV